MTILIVCHCHRAPTDFAHGWGSYLKVVETRPPKEIGIIRKCGKRIWRPPRVM